MIYMVIVLFYMLLVIIVVGECVEGFEYDLYG